nr:MAG TPA: protein of unknown function DUF859 [Caudoviricetes sp.]
MATFGTSNKYINYSVNSQELSYDINSNTSVVRVWIDVWRTNTGYTTYGTGTVYARINGGVYSAGISTGQKITSTPIRLGTWDVTVGHNADGSKAISVTGWISHSQFSSSEQGYTHTLTTIPRQANITESSNFTDVQNPTIKFSNPGGFNMSVWLEPNPNGPHLAVRDNIPNTGSYTWELTDEERNQLREACKGKTCTIRIGLYSNNKQWASYHDRTYTITNANPSFTSITATPVNPFGSLYLQGKSSIKLTINGAKGIYGSTITTYSIKGGDYSYSGESNTYTTDVLSKSGDITFTATITDSRGFTASKTVKVTVTAYTLPTLTFETYRCDSSGTKDIIKGTYIYVKPTFTYCVITGNAIKTKSIKINNTGKSTAFNSGQGYVFSGYALNTTHEVEISITDNVGNTVTVIHDIDIGKVILNIPPHKNGVGWGRYCNKEGEFQIEYDLNIFGKILKNGEELPVFTKNGNYSVPPAPIEKKDIYFKYSTEEQFTGEYWIDGKKIYVKSYNLGTINAFKKIENIANFDRNIRYEFSMRANDKISGMNGNSSTDLFVTTGGDVYINTNGNTRYDVVLTLWYTKN